MASSRRESSVSWRRSSPPADVHVRADEPEAQVRGTGLRGLGRRGGSVSTPVDAGASRPATRRRGRRLPCARGGRGRRRGLPPCQLVEVGLAVAIADGPQRVRREREGFRRFGVELVVAARGRLAAGCIHRPECIGRAGHGEGDRAGSARAAARHAGAGDPEHPDVARWRRRRPGRRAGAADLLEAGRVGVRPVEHRRPSAVPGLGDDEPAGPEVRGEVQHVRRATRPGSASVGTALGLGEPDREVVDDGAAAVERRADRRQLPCEHVVGALRVPGAAAERRQEGDREQGRGEDREQRPEPGHRPRPALASGQRGDAGVERPERGHDQEHRHRHRCVQERPPRRRDREQQARREEREHADDQDRPDGAVAGLPREREQPDHRHRDADEQQDVEQVVADPRRPHLEQCFAGPPPR